MTGKEHNLEERGMSLDKQLTCLSDTTRRRILTTLAAQNPQDECNLEEVAFKPSNEKPAKLRAEAHHIHLPKLANAGLIDWDRDSNTITRGPNFEQIQPFITLITDHQDELPADWP